MVTALDVINELESLRNDEQRTILMRCFKTAPGQYGEGDMFLGLKVPQTRSVVHRYKHLLSLDDIAVLLYSPWHEIRLCGFLLLVEEMKSALPGRVRPGDEQRRKELVEFYLKHARRANNWDLVDLSCPGILGYALLYAMPGDPLLSPQILDRLAASDNLWEQRIAIVSTMPLIKHCRFAETLRIASKLSAHPHDLIHKAVGWMLREIGKKNIDVLRDFLSQNIHALPRTALRYAIERMSEDERRFWLGR